MYSELITQEQITIPISISREVSVVDLKDEAAAIATVVMGFSTDPVARWVYPRTGQYLTHFPVFIQALAGNAFSAGTAFATSDFSGAALWLPPGVGSDEEAIGSLIEESIDREIIDDVYEFVEQMGHNHPTEPHWYLPMIAVDTYRQNEGIGTALLRASLERCDRAGLPAYLESSNPRNISLYRRFGFEVVGEIQCGSSPTMYPMRREPLRSF
jgi:ribosomal protein S18 acetylase RimI-like enzyme